VESGARREREQALEDYEGGAAGQDLEFVLKKKDDGRKGGRDGLILFRFFAFFFSAAR